MSNIVFCQIKSILLEQNGNTCFAGSLSLLAVLLLSELSVKVQHRLALFLLRNCSQTMSNIVFCRVKSILLELKNLELGNLELGNIELENLELETLELENLELENLELVILELKNPELEHLELWKILSWKIMSWKFRAGNS